MNLNELVVLFVHGRTVDAWAEEKKGYGITSEQSSAARVLQKRFDNLKRSGVHIVHFEYNPWFPEGDGGDKFPPGSEVRPSYRWEDFVTMFNGKHVLVAGVRRTQCVQTVFDEITKRGVKARVSKYLTID